MRMKRLSLILVMLIAYSAFSQSNPLNQRAFWKKHPSIESLKELIKEGYDPTEFNDDTLDPISLAIIEDNSIDIVSHLLSFNGNDINKKTSNGRTYIFWAGFRNNLELMDYLISKGAKTDIIDRKGYSLVNFIANSGIANSDIYNLCLKHGSDFKKEKTMEGANPVLLLIPHIENDNMIKYFAKYGVLHTALDNNGNNAFAYAASKGNITMMNWLLKNDIQLDHHANNAFLFATKGQYGSENGIAVYDYLVKKGIDPLLKDEQGNDAFHYLVSYGSKEQISWFISKGALLTNKNKKNVSAFMRAMYNNDLEAIEYIKNQKIDVDHKDNKRQTALVHLFLSYNKMFNNSFEAKLNLLEKHGAYKNVINNERNNLYHIAVLKDAPQLLQIASRYQTDINLANGNDLTPLQLASKICKNARLIKLLYKMGADITKKTKNGNTAYDIAKENKFLNDSNLEFLKNK